MSWSSGSSVAPGGGQQRVADGRTPVAYREDAMAYEPAMMCRCKPSRKAPRWISWSARNPGRRYFACVYARDGGCGYVEWFDPPLTQFLSELVGDLRDEVYRLRSTVQQPERYEQPEEQPGRGSIVQALQDELKGKDA